jgi:alcohol dehydrogenase
VGLMMPHVIRWNSEAVGSLYLDLVQAAGWANEQTTSETAASQLADGLTELLLLARMPVSISEATERSASEKVLMGMAGDAIQQWTGTFNPRKMDLPGFLELYRNAL